MEEVAWRPCRRVPHASLMAVESMRFPSLRLVNNDDGDDNEAIYRHALAHVLVDVRRFESFREFAIFTRDTLVRERTASPLAMKGLDRSKYFVQCQLFLFTCAKSHRGISSTIDDTTLAEIQPHKRQFAYFAKRVAWVTSASGRNYKLNEASFTCCCSVLRARGESRWFPTRARNRNSGIEESSLNDSPFPRRFVAYATRTLRIPRESATPKAVHRIIVPWTPMIPSGSFTADDSSSSIVTEASCIRACCAITTISRQIGSSASTRATYAPENGILSRYSEFETADEERKPLGGCGIGGGGKPYRKLWEWVDGSDGIRVVAAAAAALAAAAARKGVQEGKRKKLPAAAAARTEGRRTGKKAAAAAAVNGKVKRKSEAEEERGRPSVGGAHRCGGRRGQSAAA
ncbi:hypothetical protein ALC57_07303 [Trachymyrmex cornetzi]|uniref:Uncharacterized protein n=1 Tax=Trachymyrmex cornetzi TaxID=471704 RepID=A0A195E5G2_9HYME|nr:hypothetical protein ALC57_07303 [Trachymyrmex cornetzi]